MAAGSSSRGTTFVTTPYLGVNYPLMPALPSAMSHVGKFFPDAVGRTINKS